jgi:NAD(P) transhydrogenase subunit beta
VTENLAPRELAIQAIYLASAVFFILGLRGLSGPEKARTGMAQAAFGMLLAIVGTLLHAEIVRYDWILAGLLIGSFIGVVIGRPLFISVPMTAMPQWVALSHAAGAVAATLVGLNEYVLLGAAARTGTMAALGFEVVLGALTVTGSVMAFGKLQ